MSRTDKKLGERIKALRQRHFGRGGKGEFAKALGLPIGEYERFERGAIPTGETLVRMCETSGEDLQWLLTGVGSRGTMVISGARDRHQELIAKVARLLDAAPESAPKLDAFVDLLVESERVHPHPRPELPAPRTKDLVPILAGDELPNGFNAQNESLSRPAWLPTPMLDGCSISRCPALLAEPDVRSSDVQFRELNIVRITDGAGAVREFVECEHVAGCFPDMFGVRIHDDTMSPLLCQGDVALVAPSVPAQTGRPPLCGLADRRGAAYGVWLEQSHDRIVLGRLSDGGEDSVDAAEVMWSLEVLYRVRPAA